MFPAADVEQLTYIEKVIDECDYYVLVIGARYGSLDEEGVSYTQREYEYAVKNGKTVIAFPHRQPDAIPQGKTDKDDSKRHKLEAFLAIVTTGRLVQYWESAMELRANAIVSLTKAFSESPQTGWVRANLVASESALSDVVKYREENDKLRSELNNLRTSIAPKFDDVASLDTEFKFPFTYRERNAGQKSSITLPAYKFFMDVAATLFNPVTLEGVKVSFDRAITERHGRVTSGYGVSSQRTQIHDVLLHLVASGLVRMESAKSTDRKRSVTGYQLTPLGIKYWQENSYVKSEV
ncbi:hypothetical protein PMI02_04862 [Novosphingobium sp. AP12]|nr:hypothetical protein PMI02_04862 [Novosphingobium sp. AP12]